MRESVKCDALQRRICVFVLTEGVLKVVKLFWPQANNF